MIFDRLLHAECCIPIAAIVAVQVEEQIMGSGIEGWQRVYIEKEEDRDEQGKTPIRFYYETVETTSIRNLSNLNIEDLSHQQIGPRKERLRKQRGHHHTVWKDAF